MLPPYWLSNARTIPAAILLSLAAACDYPYKFPPDMPCTGPFCSVDFSDATEKASDIAFTVGVQRAEEATTGNVILGGSGPLGGSGWIAVDVRATTVRRHTPDVQGVAVQIAPSSATSTDFPTTEGSATSVTADLAVRIIRGFAVGTTRVGGLDLLGSVTRFQPFGQNSLHLTSDGEFGSGVGARVGLLQETHRLPGVSYSRFTRRFPSYSFRSDPMSAGDGQTAVLEANHLNFSTTGWRLAASKHIGQFDLTTGIGGDTHRGSGSALATINLAGPSKTSEGSGGFVAMRRNVFLGAAYRVRGAALVGDIGRTSQTGHGTRRYDGTNTFDGATPERSRGYLSLGVRLGNVP